MLEVRTSLFRIVGRGLAVLMVLTCCSFASGYAAEEATKNKSANSYKHTNAILGGAFIGAGVALMGTGVILSDAEAIKVGWNAHGHTQVGYFFAVGGVLTAAGLILALTASGGSEEIPKDDSEAHAAKDGDFIRIDVFESHEMGTAVAVTYSF